VHLPAWTRLWRFQAGRSLDLGIFGVGFYYAFFAPKAGTNPLEYVFRDRWVGAVMLAAWAAQRLGGWLKRLPLQRRLAERAGQAGYVSPLEAAEGQILIFTGWHALISPILFFAGVANLLPELNALDSDTHWWVVLLMIAGVAVSLVPTVFVRLALAPLKAPTAAPAWRSGRSAEVAADQLLVFSYLVLSLTIFGSPALFQGTKPFRPNGVLEWMVALFLLAPLLWIALTWFFVPFRMLLLIDELGTWKSRLSLLLGMAPIIAKYIVG